MSDGSSTPTLSQTLRKAEELAVRVTKLEGEVQSMREELLTVSQKNVPWWKRLFGGGGR